MKHSQCASQSTANDTIISDSTKSGLEQHQNHEKISLDRTNDSVYSTTTNVVKAIMLLSQGVEKGAAVEYLNLVRHVGIELRSLLTSVDTLASIFPPQALKYNSKNVPKILSRRLIKI